jgi:hypothetical protein
MASACVKEREKERERKGEREALQLYRDAASFM